MMDKNQFDLEDLLADETFQQFCSGTDEASVAYWKQTIEDHPEWKPKIEEGKRLFDLLNCGQGNLNDQKQSVLRRLDAPTPVRSTVRALYLRWLSVAAVLVVGILSFWMWKGSGEGEDRAPLAVTQLQGDIEPGGNKAVLTLADGSRVVLDSVHNGAVTTQGNVTIIKLDDGRLTYDKKDGSLDEVLYNTITTPRGGQYQLVLADGSKVWLNAASSLKFPNIFKGGKRQVTLTGEGYFEISHDETKPFYVNVGNMEVKVLGTHFNVNAYTDEEGIKTTLLEGSVQISDDGASVLLTPGEQARLQPVSHKLQTTSDVNVDEVVAWKNGLFQFSSTDIRAILRQAARWYDADVVYQGYTNETFSGSLPRSGSISHLLKILEATGKIAFEINGKQIIVKPK